MDLRGQFIYHEPLKETHRETLRGLAKDERIWEYTKTLLVNDTFDQQFDEYFNTALELEKSGGQAFVIRLTAGDGIIGMTRLYEVYPKDKRLSIGYTWYIPAVWGKVYNKESKLLLLQHAFETLQYNRVEFTVAGQNIRSQKAVEKIGGVKEGMMRKYGYRNDGSRLDKVIFSIIDDEWPEKKQALQQLMQQGSR